MANPIVSDLPFTERIDMREKALAWISRDTGLQEFLVPDELTSKWSADQKKVWTTTVIDRFMSAKHQAGREARARVFARENAGWLRRACVRLQQDLSDHRDLTRMAVLLETLWNEVSATLSDSRWAECYIMFDSALISLRVAYVWLYDKLENEDADLQSRKNVFETVVNSFFNAQAPTDDKADKHSANFRALQRVWRTEFESYTKADDLEAKLKRLEESQNLMKVATAVSKFLNAVDVDSSWMWEMQRLQEDIKAGNVKRRQTPKKRREPAPEPPEPESSGSYEPRAADSDFDIHIAEKVASNEDEEEESEEESDELMRGSMSQRKDNGTTVRRSMRVAKAKVDRYRPTHGERKGRQKRAAARRAALRFSESPTPSLSDDVPIAHRGRPQRGRRTGRVPARIYEGRDVDPNDDVANIRRIVKLPARSNTRRAMPRSGISRGRVLKDGRRRTTLRSTTNVVKDDEDEDGLGDYGSLGTALGLGNDDMHGDFGSPTIGGSIPGAPVSLPDRRTRLAALLEPS